MQRVTSTGPRAVGDRPVRRLWWRPPARPAALAGWALLPLRLFLGATFCFAGLQKLANPHFFAASSPTSIQAQLAGAARTSPIGGLIGHLGHEAVAIGLVIALGELAAGLGTLLGVWSRVAAAGGVALSLSLFLTVSFHSSPYYTGSDIVFLFAWLPLVVAGDGGVLSVQAALRAAGLQRAGALPDAVVAVPFSVVREVCGQHRAGACAARADATCEPAGCPWLGPEAASSAEVAARQKGAISRRDATGRAASVAVVAAVGAALAGLTAWFGRAVASSASARTLPSLGGGSGGATSASSSGGPGTRGSQAARGVRIGPADKVPVGSGATFVDPASGAPSVVIQPRRGEFLAYDAVCPHAGCIVAYLPAPAGIFRCPCHHSEFNQFTGAREAGPAPHGLRRIPVEDQGGDLYVDG